MPDWSAFPFDLLREERFPGRVGERMASVRDLSMIPPAPWGQWLYARLFAERCAGLDGDLIEVGVGLGGMSLFLAMLVQDLGLDRQVLAVDSFEGLPAPTAGDNPYFSEHWYASERGSEGLLSSLWMWSAKVGVADRVVPVQGFFEDVLPELDPDRAFSFVHIDGDLYESVACALEHLYDRVPEGGVIAVDDFFHPAQGPLRATCAFFNSRSIVPVYHVVFPYSVFVIKGETATGEGRARRSVDGNVYSLDWLSSDDFFLGRLEASAKQAGDARRRTNSRLLLETLRASEDSSSAIYDYWRALEEFWLLIDNLPEESPTLMLA